MKRLFFISLLMLAPQVALADTAQCSLVQVHCLPSVNEVQVRLHDRKCIDIGKYTEEDIATLKKDNIYLPYQKWEHDKPLEPRTFTCEMGGNTITLELGATKPDLGKPGVSGKCIDYTWAMPYTKWFLNGEAVSEKLYLENPFHCLTGYPSARRSLNQLTARANKPDWKEQLEWLELEVYHGTRFHVWDVGGFFGKPDQPITYEDVQVKDFPER